MKLRIDDLELGFGPAVWWRRVSGTTTPPPPENSITPVLRVSHAPDNAARVTTTLMNNGSSVITGVAPLLLFFDGRDTRCSVHATNEIDAWWHLQHKLDYDETPGQTWSISGKPYGYDTGESLFGRVIEGADTRNMRYSVKNADNTTTYVDFTVIATEPPAATIIETSAGAWPTWNNNAHYALRADGDYRSFGDINMGGHHDIVISKVGAGADPRISGFNPDSRSLTSVSVVVEPSRNIRTLDIDIDVYRNGVMGPQFCGAVRGRVRAFEADAFSYIYDNSASTEVQRTNARIPRGVFFWKTGIMNPPSGSQYVMISTFRELVAQGVQFRKIGLTGNHVLRNYGYCHVYRHSEAATEVSAASIVKHQAGNGVTPWVDGEDTVGTITGTKAFEHRPASHFVMADMVYHTPTSVIPDICVGAGAENNDPGYGHGCIQFCAFSNSVSAQNAWQLVADLDVQVNGKAHSTRNIRLNNGAGAYVTQSAGAYINNVPEELRGPYLYETVDTRPTL